MSVVIKQGAKDDVSYLFLALIKTKIRYKKNFNLEMVF